MSNPPGVRTLIDGLDTQLATQHAEILLKLDALLDGLGVPIPTGTITLANIDTRLLTITTLLNSDLATMSEQLQQIYLLLANSIAPNLENAFFALNDLYALQAAGTNPRLPVPPSIINLPTGAELLHCQRVQWMIDEFFSTWMRDISNQVIALGGVGVALMLAALPVPALEGVAIPVALISSGSYALLQVLGIGAISSAATNAKKAALRQALYAATNAKAAQAAWNSTVDGFSDVDGAVRTVWKTLIWSDWFNHLYDATNHNSTTEPGKWVLTGYDGSVCAVTAGYPPNGNYTSQPGSIAGNGTRQAIAWPNGQMTNPSGDVSNITEYLPGDQAGAVIQYISGGPLRIVMFNSNGTVTSTSLGASFPSKTFDPGEAGNGILVDTFTTGGDAVFTLFYERP